MSHEVGTPLYPWLKTAFEQALQARGHALLLDGPSGLGQWSLAWALGNAWLCEAPVANRPGALACGHCAACALMAAGTHPDLLVLMPEDMALQLGWQTADDTTADDSGKKKKNPSKEIRVEAVRAAVAFAQSTSARGRGKVVLIHPAENMNLVSGNTLLKTLEEPAGHSRFVLSTGQASALLPTVRSRCQRVTLSLPDAPEALAWLTEQGVSQPDVLLRACGGEVLQALERHQQGLRGDQWLELPRQIAMGRWDEVRAWPLPQLLDLLLKICLDLQCLSAQGAPRYFPSTSLPKVHPGALAALGAWSADLTLASRHAAHPYHATLAADAHLTRARQQLLAARA